jgi:hypothetical protein
MKTSAITMKPARQMKPGLTGQPGRGVSMDIPTRYRPRGCLRRGLPSLGAFQGESSPL